MPRPQLTTIPLDSSVDTGLYHRLNQLHHTVSSIQRTHYYPAKEELQELLELAKEKNLKLRVGYLERFNPYVKQMKNTNPIFATFMRESKKRDWIKDNIVMDTSTHDIDLALWFFDGKPNKIQFVIDDNYCVIILEFTNGTAVIISKWLSNRKIRTINGIHTDCDDDVLKIELEDFLNNGVKQDWNALYVQEIVDEITKRR